MNVNIDISMLEGVLKQLNQTIEEYEQIDKNILNALKNSSFFWNDNIAKTFFNEIDKEHLNNEKVITNLKNNSEIIAYIINSYSSIGKKIKCNLNSKDLIINKIKNILYNINDILVSYGYLNTSFCPYESYLLYEEKKKINVAYNTLNTMLNNITNNFKKMEQIEKNIKLKISSLNNYVIDNFDINVFFNGD